MTRRLGLAALLALLGAACTTTQASTPTPTRPGPAVVGRISGSLLISAMREQATRGTVRISGDQTRRLTVGAGGRFTAVLPPGRYRLTGYSPLYGDGRYLCRTADDRPVALRAGATLTVDVLCIEK